MQVYSLKCQSSSRFAVGLSSFAQRCPRSVGASTRKSALVTFPKFRPCIASSSHVSAACAENLNGSVTQVPPPEVKIDNTSDPFATVVTLKFGDILGDLLDTMSALKNLELNIVRAKFDVEDKRKNKFYITDAETGEKIVASHRLEEIRMTIINNLMMYHPESIEELAAGFGKRASDYSIQLGPKTAPAIPTSILITNNEDSVRTILELSTTDRPGLLVDVVRTLKDVNVEVISAKVETLGKMAHDVLAVTYHGEPLNNSMKTLVENALYYYLARAEVEKEESY